MPRTGSLVTLLALLTSSAQANEPSFATQVLPLLKSRCLVCHMPGGDSGGLSLVPKTAYESLVNAKSTESALPHVTPGKPDESYLFLKITGRHLPAGSGERMPFNDTPLTPEEIERVRAWIAAGAQP